MEGHSRSGAFGDEAGQESGDPFDRMRNFSSLGRGADMFSHPGWGGFARGNTGDSWSMDDPMDGMEGMRPRQRPKFSSASTMMGPRPFRRERRASAGPPETTPSDAQSPQAGHGRERIIPIQVERDEVDSGAAAPRQTEQPQQQQQQPSPRQQRPYVRRGTMDTPVSTLQTEELQRDARARSAPPEAEPKAAAARVPPLNMQAAAAAATPHKPNYFNSSPKPFSAQQRPFQTPSFGAQGQIPIPVQVGRGQGHQQQQQHHHQQQQQPQQQPKQQPQPAEEPKQPPPPPPPKPKSQKERAMDTINAVQERVAELGEEVQAFTGQRGEKQHLYIDEMLTRELIKLDNVEANGDDEIRTSRKQTIMNIQKQVADLEAKVATPEELAAKAAAEAEAAAEAGEGEAEVEMEPAGDPAAAPEAAAEGASEAQEAEMKPAEVESKPDEGEAPAVEPMEVAAETAAVEAAAAPAQAAAAPDQPPAPAQDPTTAAATASPEGGSTPAAGPTPEAAPAQDPAAAPAPETADTTTSAVPAPQPAGQS